MDNVCNTIKYYFYKKLFVFIEKTQNEIDDTDIDSYIKMKLMRRLAGVTNIKTNKNNIISFNYNSHEFDIISYKTYWILTIY
jgi:hypothetical protein|uniref:Uncharacterized protein n=1 Tax=viral metagenome TaxID=1070528 RepID=A0A6C0DL12_9ZZZZ